MASGTIPYKVPQRTTGLYQPHQGVPTQKGTRLPHKGNAEWTAQSPVRGGATGGMAWLNNYNNTAGQQPHKGVPMDMSAYAGAGANINTGTPTAPSGGGGGAAAPPAEPAPPPVPGGSSVANFEAMRGAVGTPINDVEMAQVGPMGNAGNVLREDMIDPTNPTKMSAEDVASLYGNIDYDKTNIENMFNASTTGKYDAMRADYNRTEKQFSDRLAMSQGSYLETLRKANAQGIQSGANKGMQSANALQGMLGMSAQSGMDATKLAQDRRALSDQEAAEFAQNPQKAMEYANMQKTALGGIAGQLYGVDAQREAAGLGFNAQIGAANIAGSAEEVAAKAAQEAAAYNADSNRAGQKYVADTSFKTNVHNTDANMANNIYESDKGLEGTQYNADSNERSSKYANRSRGGGGGGGNALALLQMESNETMAINANQTALDVANINAGNVVVQQGSIDSGFPPHIT